MQLESSKKTINHSAKYIFDSLTHIENFEKLMPENTSKFEVIDENCFVFGLKGMPEIKLIKKSVTPHNKIVLGAASSKLPFTLTAKIDEVDAEKSDVQLFFEGEFNAMMGMMIKGPISKFMETLVENMPKL